MDLVIAVGGDGTILHVASLFNGVRTLPRCVVDCIPATKILNFGCVVPHMQEAPPILAFCKGTLGFLTPFRTASGAPVVGVSNA